MATRKLTHAEALEWVGWAWVQLPGGMPGPMFYHLDGGAVYYLDDDRAKQRHSWLTDAAEVWVEVEEPRSAGGAGEP